MSSYVQGNDLIERVDPEIQGEHVKILATWLNRNHLSSLARGGHGEITEICSDIKNR